MGKERTQPTPIDKAEYKRFRAFVQEIHGSTRGHLRTEIENALREYRERYYGGDQLTRIEDDVAQLKAIVSEVESDGGTPPATRSEPSDTHARSLQKPAPNQPRADKIAYLTDVYLDRQSCDSDGGVLVKRTVQQVVEDEYSFDTEILQDYTKAVYKRIKSEYDPEPHPVHGKFGVWGDRLTEAREEAEQLADNDMETVV